jgi:hypothetical protein
MENDLNNLLDDDRARRIAVVESIAYLISVLHDKNTSTSDRIKAAEALLKFAPVAVTELDRQSAGFN